MNAGEIGRAAAAAGRVAGAVLRGQEVLVDDGTFYWRLEACKACDAVLELGDGFLKCSVCACGLNGKIRRKAALATEDCPRRKWL